jgi:predicted nucleic acid-binding protein
VALRGWIVDKTAWGPIQGMLRADPAPEFAGQLVLCTMGQLEYLYSARSAGDYDRLTSALAADLQLVAAPPNVLDRALALQHDLAHHHGMWHRTPIGDLVIAETALYHGLGIIHVNSAFERIAAVRPSLVRRRLEQP